MTKINWYGFNHDVINKKFTGGLTYLNDFCVNDEYHPVAVYKVDNPDKSKGHKEYLLLQVHENMTGLVRGMTPEEIWPFMVQDAIRCNKCQDVIYSVNRHHMNYCKCQNCAIDGGRDYTKITGSDYTIGTLNLLTDEFI